MAKDEVFQKDQRELIRQFFKKYGKAPQEDSTAIIYAKAYEEALLHVLNAHRN